LFGIGFPSFISSPSPLSTLFPQQANPSEAKLIPQFPPYSINYSYSFLLLLLLLFFFFFLLDL
jgi:Ca2+/Na+ antiporter